MLQNQQTLSMYDFKNDEVVFYFKRGHKFGTFRESVCARGTNQFLVLCSSAAHRGKPVRADYEEVRKISEVSLLK